MKTSTGLVYLLACLLEPFMPSFSLEVLKQLNLPLDAQNSLSDENGNIERAKRPWEIIPAGHKIRTPAPLFMELKDEEVEFYREKFADRIVKAEAEAKKVTEKLKEAKISGKKDRPKKSSEAKAKAPSDTEISISRLDIRVGLITKAEKHPDVCW
ncbi:hypothetical protein ACS0TY_023399 [Phlomoides rotata]